MSPSWASECDCSFTISSAAGSHHIMQNMKLHRFRSLGDVYCLLAIKLLLCSRSTGLEPIEIQQQLVRVGSSHAFQRRTHYVMSYCIPQVHRTVITSVIRYVHRPFYLYTMSFERGNTFNSTYMCVCVCVTSR